MLLAKDLHCCHAVPSIDSRGLQGLDSLLTHINPGACPASVSAAGSCMQGCHLLVPDSTAVPDRPCDAPGTGPGSEPGWLAAPPSPTLNLNNTQA
jgi:hypothetical protein